MILASNHYKDFRTRTTSYCLFVDRRFLGIGIDIDCDKPMADRRAIVGIQLTLGWVRFWWVKYEKYKQ